jgi:hypothetical protein
MVVSTPVLATSSGSCAHPGLGRAQHAAPERSPLLDRQRIEEGVV